MEPAGAVGEKTALQEVKLENKALRLISADYERVKRAFGSQEAAAVVAASKQADKAQKWPRRTFGHDIRQ